MADKEQCSQKNAVKIIKEELKDAGSSVKNK